MSYRDLNRYKYSSRPPLNINTYSDSIYNNISINLYNNYFNTKPKNCYTPLRSSYSSGRLYDSTISCSDRLSRPISRRSNSLRERERSLSRSKNFLAEQQQLNSRSLSLNSLNSEGYISDDDRNKENSSKNSDNESKSIKKATENGEIVIDYKKLWEESQLENGILKDKLRKAEGELREAKDVLDRINSVTSKNSLSLSELEKREKRAMERKLSEMEEELKQLQKLKAENERLRTENKALTRVVNKLSNSTIK